MMRKPCRFVAPIFIWLFLILATKANDETTTTSRAIDDSVATADQYQDPNDKDHDPELSPPYWPKFGGNRRVVLLDGVWNTSRVNSSSFDSMAPALDPCQIPTLETMTIPSCVDNTPPGVLGYRGVTFFRRRFTITTSRSRSNNNDIDDDTASRGARLQLQACNFYCRIWINGVELMTPQGERGHRTGFVAFWMDVPATVVARANESTSTTSTTTTTTHEIFVLADNRFNETTAPVHTGGDFWHYGGIIRSVEWHEQPPRNSGMRVNTATSDSLQREEDNNNNKTQKRLRLLRLEQQQQQQHPPQWPWRLYAFPETYSSVKLQLHLMSNYSGPLMDNITLGFDQYYNNNNNNNNNSTAANSLPQNVVRMEPSTVTSIRGVVELGIHKVPNPRIWFMEDPQLHVVHVEMNGAILYERFGLRFWDVADSNHPNRTFASKDRQRTDQLPTPRIRLNGQIIKLVGYNHHTQWPETAASPTMDQLKQDMKILQQGGANFVRGAHYPQDPRWLDLLDEHGLVMWSETLGPGVQLHHLQSPLFQRHHQIQVQEMVGNALNHASIAIWGFFNEGPSDLEEACQGYADAVATIRALDTTRFTSYAGNKKVDVCYGTVDVISRNAYPGWLSRYVDAKTFWTDFANRIQEGVFADTAGKPFLISETGASSIYEWRHNTTPARWTGIYQSRVLADDVRVATSMQFISGIALWHLFDFKTEDRFENGTACDYLPNVEPPTCGYIYVNTSTPHGRPGGKNCKGVVDYYRRPKPAFDLVAILYNGTNKKTQSG